MSSERRSTAGSCKMEEMELRKGPWTLEEDSLLIHYIACHGEGRWNLLAKASGLKRTGKSCRLRWMNYLKPDIKKGNLTPEEQLLILELHSKLGNRWSRIAQHLPGRTDNEIKNYWRTRVQKQARQLRVDANSAMFRDAVRCYWRPRLKIDQKANSTHNSEQHADTINASAATTIIQMRKDLQPQHYHLPNCQDHHQMMPNTTSTTTPSNILLPDLESASTSSCSAVLPQLQLPSRSSPDELGSVVNFSTFSAGGFTSACDDQAQESASALSFSAAIDSDIAVHDGFWCMDELYAMFKSYARS